MTLKLQSAKESLKPMKIFEKVISGAEVSTETTSSTDTHCQVFEFEFFATPEVLTPSNHTTIADMVSEFELDDKRRAAIEEARRWAADALHSEDGETIRTMRMKKGWSQTQLARELSTSQPHIVRIERGTENLTIETCRKLCLALEVDMNELDLALKRQSDIAEAKLK